MAIRNMRLNPNSPLKTALGFNPSGVIVTNVTPYWLYFPQAEQYCPPFTSGWSAPLIRDRAGYGYMEIKTPFGQTVQTNVQTGTAQFVELTWTDSPTGFSPGESSGASGSSIDPGSVTTGSVTGLRVALYTGYLPYAGGAFGTLVPGIAGKQIRLMYARLTGGGGSFGLLTGNDSNVLVHLNSSVLGVPTRFATLAIGRFQNSDSVSFGADGLDLNPGDDLTWTQGILTVSSVNVDLSAGYRYV